ncbi:MAG: baseplate assembly protein [Rhodospirillaceae bacterium]|nr:MAG: baseplate assembly protein [Rhodospirillaceae bacterium]
MFRNSQFVAQIQQLVERVIRSRIAEPRLAIVRANHPTLYAAKVQFLPEGGSGNGVDALSGWLPILSPVVGNGFGLISPPNVGDQVLVVFQEHSRKVGIIVGRLFDLINLPPQGVPAGETWLVHKSGSFFKFTNDGGIHTQTSTWSHTGQIQVTGNVSATENLSSGNGASGSFTTSNGQTVTVQEGIITNIS